jgi:ribosomal-protein-alanine N-acetyltransferase
MAATPFVIQPANENDIHSLVELEKRVFLDSDGKLSARQFKYHIQSNNLFYVAKPTQQTTVCLGYILLLVRIKSARLYSMAIMPTSQNLGMAKALIGHALESIRARNIKKITLEVRESNYRARKLYEFFDFKKIGTLHSYYGDKEDAIAMARDMT